MGETIADPEFYKRSPDEIAAELARAKAIEAELGELYARWDALDSQITTQVTP